jgi:hypothetical protein
MTTKAHHRAEALEVRVAHATGERYPIEGHAEGKFAFIETRCDNVGRWIVLDNNLGRRAPDYWDGTRWRPLCESTQHDEAYRWTHDEAHDLAKHYAAQAAEIHQVYAAVSRPEFLRWLAGEVGAKLEAARTVVTQVKAVSA